MAILEACDLERQLLVAKNKSNFLQTRSHRGSKFRGVSKNSEKYQVMVVRGTLKKYIGAIDNEEVAGLLYDKYAIIIHGLKVRNHKLLNNHEPQ